MENDQILILGKGFIGSRLHEQLGCNISDAKIHSYQDALREIKKFSPKIIINCIGNIGSNVDECEKDLDRSLDANAFVPIILAEFAIRNQIRLVHISSGCIFHYDYEKDPPISELKDPDFFELFYSRTKIYSDQALVTLARKYPILIVRIRVPLDNRPFPRNLLTKLIKSRRVIDTPNSITYLPDFIEALKHLIKIEASGIYNIVNKSPLKYPDLVQVYKKYVPDFDFEVIDYIKLNLIRTNLVMSVKKLENTGFQMRDIYEVLEECVKSYIQYSSPAARVS